MELIYTSQAKDDLARIDWRIREKIINELKQLAESKEVLSSALKQIHDSDFKKLELFDHIIVTDNNSQELSIMSVIRKKKLKVSATSSS